MRIHLAIHITDAAFLINITISSLSRFINIISILKKKKKRKKKKAHPAQSRI
jgi:hypothetical protein